MIPACPQLGSLCRKAASTVSHGTSRVRKVSGTWGSGRRQIIVQMNSREEIQQSFEDYQLGRTGGLTP